MFFLLQINFAVRESKKTRNNPVTNCNINIQGVIRLYNLKVIEYG